MSNIPAAIAVHPAAITVHPAVRTEHSLPEDGRHLKGHRIVVEGLYLAKPAERDVEGAAAPRNVKYREEFILEPHEHRVTGQGSLGHVLSDSKLAARLSEKDPDFRAVKTHVVSSHENVWETAEEAEARLESEKIKTEEAEARLESEKIKTEEAARA